MSLASLYNLPSDPIIRLRWSFTNADQHTRVNQRLKDTANLDLPYFVLDPLPDDAHIDDFLWRHQTIHNATNAALGIIGNDLTDVDFKKEDQLKAWVWLHFQEHLQWTIKLGI